MQVLYFFAVFTAMVVALPHHNTPTDRLSHVVHEIENINEKIVGPATDGLTGDIWDLASGIREDLQHKKAVKAGQEGARG